MFKKTKKQSHGVKSRFFRKFFRSRKRVVRRSLIGANVALLAVVAGFVVTADSSSTPQSSSSSLLASSSSEEAANPLDALSSADIALNIALLANLPESAAVVHVVDAETIKDDVVASDPQIIAKPQIITSTIKTLEDVAEHVVVAGDSVASVADQYGVSADSVRWSNSLGRGDSLELGEVLLVPPIEGIVYKVVEGDTVTDIASEYEAEEARITAFNDVELTGLVPGSTIVIPDGEITPAPENNFNYSFTATYGGNTYSPGNCTWHTANRWAALGKSLPANLGNAATWASRAKIGGLETGKVPRLHAAAVTNTRGYGHVGFVEEVYPDGSFLLSEMNYNWRLYALRERIVPPAEAATFDYVY